MSDEKFDSYNVTFVFDYSAITTTVLALHPDAAPDLAADQLNQDLGLPFTTLDTAQDIVVELLDTDAL